MKEDKSYFGEIGEAIVSLATGLKVTLGEYFTPKVTEQYPENRKTTLHVSKRHRGRLVMKRSEDGSKKCVACTMCQNVCPNGSITILSEMITLEDGKKKRSLTDYSYNLGDCMFCELCVNACNFDAIEFTNDFENSVFDKNKLILHLDKEDYKSSLPNILDGGEDITIGKFNTKTK
ncbi:MAG: 4Fe-4S dicluster domain-containing protein [Prevotella sp.]|nr:4Fe-4S dicluster domain-containing protein [Prevotella sp.]